jgi:hypothetical protein
MIFFVDGVIIRGAYWYCVKDIALCISSMILNRWARHSSDSKEFDMKTKTLRAIAESESFIQKPYQTPKLEICGAYTLTTGIGISIGPGLAPNPLDLIDQIELPGQVDGL